jgi:hypothetical protein
VLGSMACMAAATCAYEYQRVKHAKWHSLAHSPCFICTCIAVVKGLKDGGLNISVRRHLKRFVTSPHVSEILLPIRNNTTNHEP